MFTEYPVKSLPHIIMYCVLFLKGDLLDTSLPICLIAVLIIN